MEAEVTEINMETSISSELDSTISNKKDVSIRQTELYKLMKPLMVYMEICFLFHETAHVHSYDGRLECRWRKAFVCSMNIVRSIWTFAPLIFLVAAGILSLKEMFDIYSTVKYEFAGLSLELFVLLFLYENGISCIVMYRNCENGVFMRVCQGYSLLNHDNEFGKKSLDDAVIRASRIVLVVCVVANLFLGITFHVLLYLMTTGQVDTACFGATFIVIFSKAPIFYYVIILNGYFAAPQFTLMAGFVYVICVILRKAFATVNKRLAASVEFDDGLQNMEDLDFDVWPFFIKYRRIIQMTNECSQLLGTYLFFYAVINLLLGSVLIYIVLFSCPRMVSTIVQSAWFLCAVLVSFIIAYSATEVNTSMISSLVSYFILLVQLSPPRDYCLSANITCSRQTI